MKTIQVYDPPMCCSTGLCGTEIDPALVNFAALLTQLSQKGVKVERFNLGQQPMAFVQNAAVKALLDKEGETPRYVEIKQGMKDAPLTRHPESGEAIRRVIFGGYGALSKGTDSGTGSDCGCAPGGCC